MPGVISGACLELVTDCLDALRRQRDRLFGIGILFRDAIRFVGFPDGFVQALDDVLVQVRISIFRKLQHADHDRFQGFDAGASPERAEFVRRSMVGFSNTLRARLVGLVLVLPVVAIVVIIVIVNYN